MRFVTPVVLLGAAAYVHYYNATHEGRVISFAFVDKLVPSVRGDMQGMGQVSVALLAALGGLLLLGAIADLVRRRGTEG